MTTPVVPTVTLNNGVTIPQLGFGVFQIPDDETAAAVGHALEAGYRSIDTAAVYGNEVGVGRALADSGIAREDLFITSKVWNSDQGYDSTLAAFDVTVGKLGLDQLDLYLIHWPTPERNLYSDTWKALQKLLADGRVRAIGVSNFEPEHLDRLAADHSVVPAVNQIELHPGLQQRANAARNSERGIAIEAWSPLAQGAYLDNPALAEIAGRLDRSTTQVILRWHLQQGRIVIPKSVTPSRIRENVAVFDFELTADDLAAVDALDAGHRTGPDPKVFNG